MSNDIHSPHDKFFKDTFSRKSAAISYLKAYLPDNLKALIDFDSLTIYPGEYIDEELKASSSDLVYQVSLLDKPAYLYFLFEHQSNPQVMMAFRLLKYILRLWDAILKEKPEIKSLPPVIPMVLYQGKVRWNASLEFIDLIKPRDDRLKCYMPNFQYLLVDLIHQQTDNIVADLYSKIALLLMRSVAEGNLFETLQRHGHLMNRLLAQDNALDLLEILFRYTLNADDSIDINHLQQLVKNTVVSSEGEKTMGTIAEKLVQQGLEKGLERGREEGEVRLIQKQIQLKFPDAEPVDLRQYSSSQLELIAQRLMFCDSLEEILR